MSTIREPTETNGRLGWTQNANSLPFIASIIVPAEDAWRGLGCATTMQNMDTSGIEPDPSRTQALVLSERDNQLHHVPIQTLVG